MSFPLKLERLNQHHDNSPIMFLPKDRLEEIKTEAFDKGVKLGIRNARQEQNSLEADLAKSLRNKIQEMSFSHFEARQNIMLSLEELVTKMVELVLPEIASDGLVAVFTRQLLLTASDLTDGPIQILCAPENVPILERALGDLPELPVAAALKADTTKTALEIEFKASGCERIIDVDQALVAIRDSITSFYNPSPQEQSHGNA